MEISLEREENELSDNGVRRRMEESGRRGKREL